MRRWTVVAQGRFSGPPLLPLRTLTLMQAACRMDSAGSPRVKLLHTRSPSEVAREFCTLEAVNGVPVAVEHEVVPTVKGEPTVAVRAKLKWSARSVTASLHM